MQTIDVFEDRGSYCAIHHDWEQAMGGDTPDEAAALLYHYLASMRDDGMAHHLTTPEGKPARDTDVTQVLAEIADYARAQHLDLGAFGPECMSPAGQEAARRRLLEDDSSRPPGR
ncbi:hypothetical protein [Streptomyces alfalfae]